MIVLGLDTTGPWCTAALVDDALVLAQKSEKIGRGHAERLAPMVQEVMQVADVKADEIDKLCVCTGPGSFTGLRVALAFAKGFALPRGLPVIGLDALAVAVAQTDPDAQKRLVAVSDVRRGELCWSAIFQGQLIKGPLTQTTEQARAEIAALAPDCVLEDEKVNGAVLAFLGCELSAAEFPATPFYARPPDAKLPGGIDPA